MSPDVRETLDALGKLSREELEAFALAQSMLAAATAGIAGITDDGLDFDVGDLMGHDLAKLASDTTLKIAKEVNKTPPSHDNVKRRFSVN